ncbi:ROK family protein [Tunturiibacter lichenicola]|uniref:ROK family protein n=1 Tax=Tunturiibacter lichenicola TaxID=2051959 RepID=UPI0021B256E9|nr:ROK family protein [Edaphobacter lichenicola]
MAETYSIGVDLGGTNLRVAAYEGGREFLETIVLPTRLNLGRDQVVRDMCDAVRALGARDFGHRRLAGIAVGSPGPLELPAGILRNLPNFPGWDGFNLKSAIATGLGCDIVLENDANLAAFAEQRLGAGTKYGVSDLCVITLGTGVGNGLVLNGKIWDGANGMAGEAGHMVVQAEERSRCGCGGYGCLEQYASATAVIRMARESLGDAVSTAHEVAMLARSGSELARNIFDTAGRALAIALTGLINTLNLPLYLLGGGVCEAWDLLSCPMFRELERRSYVYRLTKPEVLEPIHLLEGKTYVLKAELGALAGLLGACVAGLEARLPPATLGKEILGHQ